MSEAAKKVSDLKRQLWEISKNAVIILAFMAAVFRGDGQYIDLKSPHWKPYIKHAKCINAGVLLLYFVYLCTIYWQARSNTNKYMEIYRKAGQKLYSDGALYQYFQDKPANMIEDEGRLTWFLFLVVFAFFVLVLVQIYNSP
jgi:hypothetical protein